MRKTRPICLMSMVVILGAMLCLTSCNDSGNSGAGIAEIESPGLTTNQVRKDSTAIAGRRAGGEPDREMDWEADLEALLQSNLRRDGVDDFSTASLIAQMDSKIPAVRANSARLLGHRKEVSAIPRLEAALHDESLNMQIAATRALLNMGNRLGIKVMEDFCEKASKEFDRGEYNRNTLKYSDMAQVLADAGEVSAIAHLRRLLEFDQLSGVRMRSLRSLEKLYEKDPSVLADIATMKNDEDPQVRREAENILERLNKEK